MRKSTKKIHKCVKIVKAETMFDSGHRNSSAMAVDTKTIDRTGGKASAMTKTDVRRCLSSQNVLIRVKEDIVRRLQKSGTCVSYSMGDEITKEGDDGKSVYFILRGSVGVKLKGRQIAIRKAKECVGEMSALDPTQRRCASLVANENTDILKVGSNEFGDIIDSNIIMMKNEAIELCARLRERSKFHMPTNSVPEIFIGSSTEGRRIAERFQKMLDGPCVRTKIWTKGVFALSQSNLASLIKEAVNCDFAVLVLTPDDLTNFRGKEKMTPRDNVIFELGLFMGSIGRDRTYMLAGGGAKLPTDLDGITRLNYLKHKNGVVKLDEAVEMVKNAIHDKGVK